MRPGVPNQGNEASSWRVLPTPLQQQSALPLFHSGRPDRSGAVIQDMLLAHAYAFQRNQSYGGACFNSTNSSSLRLLDDHRRMINALGLSHVLRLACPNDNDGSSMTNAPLTNAHLYTRFGTRLWTIAWLDHIRSQQRGIADMSTSSQSGKSIAVHMRRGDVSLCDPSTRDRYLPNQYYLSLLQPYAERSNVTVYSELQSPESWNDFGKYHVALDQPPERAWAAMMQADVLILSKSSFSIVPAIFNRHGTIVYTPFWVLPLPTWTVVDGDTVRTGQRANLRLASQICN